MEGPKHLTALELLESTGERKKPALENQWGFIVGAFLGFSGACGGNAAMGRPALAGIQRHIISALLLGSIFQWVRFRSREWYAERDAMFRHYIQLHPEDFIIPEPRKVGELLEDWYPTR